MEASSSKSENLAPDLGVDIDLSLEAFIWDWYIRLKVQFPVTTNTDLSTNLDDVSKEFGGFWQSSFSRPSHSSKGY